MTWIKICGTTNLEDALMSVEAGADALGFVFWEKSPRNVDVRVVREIVAELPVHVEKVGVFVGEPFVRVCEIVQETNLTAVQLHYTNHEYEEWRTSSFKKYLVIQTGEARSSNTIPKWASGILLDSGTPQKPGGTGQAFDWQEKKPTIDALRDEGHRLVVAGGLTPGNVGDAIRILEPWGVDVVSGVEARPGKKDPAKVKAFIEAVRAAEKK